MDKRDIPMKLDTLRAQTSMGQPDEPAHYTIEVLACPKCAAPTKLLAGQDLTQPVQCPFCDAIYTVRQSQDNALQLKKELQAWLEQMIVSNSSNGIGSVDANARHYIFTESLYPTLKRDIDRQLEAFENVLEAPLVEIEATRNLHDYRLAERLMAMTNGGNQWLKTLSTRVLARQLLDFAVTQDDKQKLQQLQMRVLNLIYYANIAQHQHSPTPTSYYTIRQNIVTLQKDYQSYIQSVDDEHYLSYIYALDARMKGAILLLDLLISVLDTGSTIAPEKMLLQINETLRQINDASQLARICTYNSFYTSSLREGIQKDLIVAHIIAVVVSSFEVVTRTQAEEFKTFYKRLMQYVGSLASVQSAKHLLWLLTSVGRVLSAQLGDDPLHVLKDWSWLETAVEANRLKATFGMSAGETARVVGLHYHPYWIARISYSLVSGVLVRKASEHEGFLLTDATSADALSVTPVIETDPALPFVELGAQSLQLLDRQIISLPAVLTRDMAEQALKAYKHAHEGDLKILATSVLGILYLPAASVCYTAKNKQRTIILGHLSGINQQLEQVLKQTQNFLRIHV